MTVKEAREWLSQFDDNMRLYQYDGSEWKPIKSIMNTPIDWRVRS